LTYFDLLYGGVAHQCKSWNPERAVELLQLRIPGYKIPYIHNTLDAMKACHWPMHKYNGIQFNHIRTFEYLAGSALHCRSSSKCCPINNLGTYLCGI